MSIKDDLMFPFGNPYREKLVNHTTITALNNVIKLAKDKLRIVNGEPEEILMLAEGPDIHNAKISIREVENLLEYINGKEKTDTN